jgi:membrane protein YqaA with SNARE-associated domain
MSESPSQDVAATTKKPNIVKRMYQWVLHWAETPYGTPALFGLSFAESSFFPIPPDVLQIALSISKPKRSFYYATVSMIASVLGAILGWYIGYGLWAGLGPFFMEYVPGVNQKNFDSVEGLYNAYGFMAITVAAFTPLPYKVFTIAAGVFHVSLPVLIVASIFGRSARFFTVATCIFFFGPTVKYYIDKYFDWAMIVFAVLLIGGFLLIEFVLH